MICYMFWARICEFSFLATARHVSDSQLTSRFAAANSDIYGNLIANSCDRKFPSPSPRSYRRTGPLDSSRALAECHRMFWNLDLDIRRPSSP